MLRSELNFVRIPVRPSFLIYMEFRTGRIPLTTQPDIRSFEELTTVLSIILVCNIVGAILSVP